ncbi:COG3650 family protein [Pontixanthobacter sp.]|uniref:COG3650 family protein n=1 Tax=Pontixanthobacter sp. TaxID=2792078 RepID=UPI003C7A31C1
MTRRLHIVSVLASGCLLASLSGCQRGPADGTVTADNAEAYSGIAADEVLRFGGNEPFWGGEVAGETLIYTTPENPDGAAIAVKRFAGMNGLGYSGTLGGQAFDMVVTPATCSDTMADRTYPFAITLSIGEQVRNGCGWTDRQPATGDQNP